MSTFSWTRLTLRSFCSSQWTVLCPGPRSTNQGKGDLRVASVWVKCSSCSSSLVLRIRKTSREIPSLRVLSFCIRCVLDSVPMSWRRWTMTGNTWMSCFRIAQCRAKASRRSCNSSEHASKRTSSQKKPPTAFTHLTQISSCCRYRRV